MQQQTIERRTIGRDGKEVIDVMTLPQMLKSFAAGGSQVIQGIAICPCCGIRTGYAIVGQTNIITCFSCHARLTKQGNVNDFNRDEKGWKVAPSADSRRR